MLIVRPLFIERIICMGARRGKAFKPADVRHIAAGVIVEFKLEPSADAWMFLRIKLEQPGPALAPVRR